MASVSDAKAMIMGHRKSGTLGRGKGADLGRRAGSQIPKPRKI
jgi:hypothetical protein